ncbi:THAP domain-containing protein 1-like [Polyodon spathula]|uniref:THAP domain-containing protein 1-like n=1 Tax=Polyodon spathula TaxID=7913 RepID=UPI001B7D9BC3|nr:THAP domain-containing protein 1-like [Polyodon spathula]
MPDVCCAVGCTNRRGKQFRVSFYRIPAEPDRRAKWISAINRVAKTDSRNPKSKTDWTPTQYTRLCSEHFIKGKKSDNPLSPDYVPSIFNHTPSTRKNKRARDMERFEGRQDKKRKRPEEESEAAAGLLDLSATQQELQDPVPPVQEVKARVCESEHCRDYIRSLESECQALREENDHFKTFL